jgi:tetratricopeptide (TPR) repeat protein
MKKIFIIPLLVVLVVGLSGPAAFAQAMGTVKGVCKDIEGKLITGAEVEWNGTETGRKYSIKTNNKGEYFSLGITPGKYNVRLLKDGKEIWHINNVSVGVDEVQLDFDLKKEQANSAQASGMTAEQVKQVQEQQAQVAKEKSTIGQLNEKLKVADEATKAGDFDGAIKAITEATEMDATRDVLWARLGDAYRNSAIKQTDPAEKKQRLESAVTDYQKAVDIKQKEFEAATTKKPEDIKQLAAYYNNLGDAANKSGHLDDSVKAYTQAAQVDPAGAGGYYFNMGAVLTNAGRADEAIVAFDRAIAADPNKASAYYWKGVNLIAKETTDKNNKVIAPPGTAEAFQKYLELDPTGTFAQPAKDMLASIGASVETSFGTKKKPAVKK